jgi:hypothetical protein
VGVNGVRLASGYYRDVVGPALASRWPSLTFAAGRLGSGSDVLGLDDGVSTDHDWGLRLTLLVPHEMVGEVRDHLDATIPDAYAGLPTRIPLSWQTGLTLAVDIADPESFATSRLGIPITRDWDADDWLTLTGQGVLEVTAGPLFVDTAGVISGIRERLAWYPDDVWRWVIAAGWKKIAEEFPFIGRTGERGDDLGSRIITARIARTTMHLGFMLERRWPPYSKWLGAVFATLPALGAVSEQLGTAVSTADWRVRERALVAALETVASVQRDIGLPARVPVVEPFFDRPYLAVTAIHDDVLGTIDDERLRARTPLVGAPDQWSDSVPALLSPVWRSPTRR